MKKYIITLIVCIALVSSITALATDEITVTVNGEVLETPIAPQLVNDRTMLPMRAIFEKLGAQVTWFESDQIIFATKGNSLITLQIGTPTMSVQTTDCSANNIVTLDTAPYIDGDYTLVPVRAIAEALSAQVDWSDETQTVSISTKQ